MSLEKIIAEALAGRPLEMKEAFEAEIQTRIQARLEAEYMNVLESKDEDIDLDEYSIDEIEEFMQTEDYENLDELSQDALRKYRDAAGDDRDDVKRYGMSVDGQKNAARKEREAAQALIKKRNQGIKTATRKIGDN